MTDREEIEKLLAGVRVDRDNAEATATHAAESLIRQASGLTKLEELDVDQIRATADDFAGSVERLKLWTDVARRIRHVLM